MSYTFESSLYGVEWPLQREKMAIRQWKSGKPTRNYAQLWQSYRDSDKTTNKIMISSHSGAAAQTAER